MSAIADRPRLPPPTGQVVLPDVPSWSWHECALGVGCWHFRRLYERLGLRPTLSVDARVCDDDPRVASACRDAASKFMSHVRDQMPIHKVEDQRGMIHRSTDRLESITGSRPVGWLGPGLTQTFETPELLAEAGVRCIGDWVYDDEPRVIRTANRPLVTLPCTVGLNDIPMMIVQHHESGHLTQRALDAVDRRLREAEEEGRPKICALAIHPDIGGQPHRIRYPDEVYAELSLRPGVAHLNGRPHACARVKSRLAWEARTRAAILLA